MSVYAGRQKNLFVVETFLLEWVDVNPNDNDDVAGDDVNATEQSGLKSTRQGATISHVLVVLYCIAATAIEDVAVASEQYM